MKITGQVFDGLKRTMGGGYEPIPSAKVFISNADGQITPRKIGTVSNMTGQFSLDVGVKTVPTPMGPVPMPDVDGKYITASFGGLIKTLPLTATTKYDFDLGIKSGIQDVQEVTVSVAKPKPVNQTPKKIKALPFIIGGAIALVATGIYFLTRKK